MESKMLQGIWSQWGVANSLTLMRCVLTLPVMVAAFYGAYYEATLLAVLAAISVAEGLYARYTGTETELGRVFDPLADKFFCDVALLILAFVSYNPAIFLLALVTIAYDVDNTTRRLTEIVAACENRTRVRNDTPVTPVSKIKTALLFVVVILGFYALAEGMPSSVLTLSAAFALLLVVISWIQNRKATITRLF